MEHLSCRLNLCHQKLFQLDELRRFPVEIWPPHSDCTVAEPWPNQSVLDAVESWIVCLSDFNIFWQRTWTWTLPWKTSPQQRSEIYLADWRIRTWMIFDRYDFMLYIFGKFSLYPVILWILFLAKSTSRRRLSIGPKPKNALIYIQVLVLLRPYNKPKWGSNQSPHFISSSI